MSDINTNTQEQVWGDIKCKGYIGCVRIIFNSRNTYASKNRFQEPHGPTLYNLSVWRKDNKKKWKQQELATCSQDF